MVSEAHASRSELEAKAEKEAAISSAIKEADKSKFISSEAMNAWIDSWDTDGELPFPKPE